MTEESKKLEPIQAMQALNLLYSATRQTPFSAEVHEKMKESADIVALCLQELNELKNKQDLS